MTTQPDWAEQKVELYFSHLTKPSRNKMADVLRDAVAEKDREIKLHMDTILKLDAEIQRLQSLLDKSVESEILRNKKITELRELIKVKDESFFLIVDQLYSVCGLGWPEEARIAIEAKEKE